MTENDVDKFAQDVDAVLPDDVNWVLLIQDEDGAGAVMGSVDDEPRILSMIVYSITQMGAQPTRDAIVALKKSLEAGIAKDD